MEQGEETRQLEGSILLKKSRHRHGVVGRLHPFFFGTSRLRGDFPVFEYVSFFLIGVVTHGYTTSWCFL